MNYIKNHKGLLTVGAVVAVLVILIAVFYSSVNSTRNTIIQKEQALAAQYQSNQNELSTYILQFKESLGVADAGSDKLDKILGDAISGRYDGEMEPGTGGAMFSAITEAYPDLTATSASYAKVQDLVVSGRAEYRNAQNLLLDKIRDYKTWTKSGLMRSFVVETVLDAPTEDLKVTVGDATYRGLDALDKMEQLVLTQEAVDAYETGTTEPLIGNDR